MSRQVLSVVVYCLALSPALFGQTIDLVDDATLPRFEVASIKAGAPAASRGMFGFPPGRFVQENLNLFNTVLAAFGVRPDQLGPLPDLAQHERFTINAKAPDGAQPQERMFMLRALLVDRFKLRYHVERKEEDAFELVFARKDGWFGPQLHTSTIDCPARLTAQRQKQAVPPLPEGALECGVRNGAGVINFGGMPIAILARMLSNQTGRQVIDRTGIVGNVDVDLHWSLQATTLRAGPDATLPVPPDDAPSIFTAIQEQLGLRLENSRAPMDRLFIDHIEPPELD
jgi:uncharacterized protein (TIGR03435 family)